MKRRFLIAIGGIMCVFHLYCQKRSIKSLFIIFLILLLLPTSCSEKIKGSSLLGNWIFINDQDGRTSFQQDLTFKENGQLFFEDGSIGHFIISAPQYLNISWNNHSEFIKFDLTNNSLKLYFESGFAQYSRQGVIDPPSETTADQSSDALDNLNALRMILGNNMVITPENAAGVEELIRFGNGRLVNLAVSPDGKLVAVLSDIGLWVFNPSSIKEVHFLPVVHMANLSFAPDGRTIALIGKGEIQFWDLQEYQKLSTINVNTDLYGVAYSPDGKTLAVGGYDGILRLFDTLSSTLVSSLSGHESYILCLAYSPDGTHFASGGWDGKIRLWDSLTKKRVALLDTDKKDIYDISFSSNGQYLLAGASENYKDQDVTLWDVQDRTLITGFEGYSFSFSPDGERLAIGDLDGMVRVGDLCTTNYCDLSSTIELIGKNSGGGVGKIAFLPDGRTMVTGSADGSVRLWDARNGKQLKALNGFSNFFHYTLPEASTLRTLVDKETDLIKTSMGGEPIDWEGLGMGELRRGEYSPDGQYVAGVYDMTGLWNTKTGKKIDLEGVGTDEFNFLAFSPDSQLVAGVLDGTARLWSTNSGKQHLSMDTIGNDLTPLVEISPNAQFLVSSNQNEIHLYSIDSGDELFVFEGYIAKNEKIAFSQDERYLVLAIQDKIIVWNLQQGKLLNVLEGDTLYVERIEFSFDGQMIAIMSYDEIIVWSFATAEEVVTIQIEEDNIWRRDFNCVSFSPDGQILASGSPDAIMLWNTTTGEQLVLLQGHSDNVYSLAFSPDGQLLISYGDDGTLRFWGIP